MMYYLYFCSVCQTKYFYRSIRIIDKSFLAKPWPLQIDKGLELMLFKGEARSPEGGEPPTGEQHQRRGAVDIQSVGLAPMRACEHWCSFGCIVRRVVLWREWPTIDLVNILHVPGSKISIFFCCPEFHLEFFTSNEPSLGVRFVAVMFNEDSVVTIDEVDGIVLEESREIHDELLCENRSRKDYNALQRTIYPVGMVG